jgi:MFS family permease
VADREMQAWRDAWSDIDAPDLAETRAKIAKLIRRHRLLAALRLAGNIAFAVALLAGSFVFAEKTGEPEMIFWAIAVWIATLVALALALEAWRKEQTHDAEPVAGFTGFYRKKATSDRWKARTGATLLAVLFAVSAAWFTVDLLLGRIGGGRYATVLGVEIAICAIWALAFVRMWRNATAVLKRSSDEAIA